MASTNMMFPGGIGKIRISDAASFDTQDVDDPADQVIEIDEDSIADEGTEFPDPEAVTAALANDKEGRMGVDQTVNIRLTAIDMADYDWLELRADRWLTVFIEVTSMKTYSDDTPYFVVVYKKVLLRQVAHAPVKKSREEYGGTIIMGTTTGSTTKDLYEITSNDPPV